MGLTIRCIGTAVGTLIRWLLRRPPPAPTYPRTVEGVLSSGRPYRYSIKSDPRLWPDPDESTFTAPVTVALDHPDDDPSIEHERPKMFPPLAVQIAALRQHTLELTGLLDDDDVDQEQDRKLLWFFRRQRDRAD